MWEARYYDPVLGRFMGVDPATVDPGNVHSFNRYAYANNNPYKYVDPDGHSPIDVAFLIYDLGKLGVAVYTGVGVGHALSRLNVAPRCPFARVEGRC
ncbi:RHS repeat-associated core domain-containing protein [Candidatus Aalborgicola defluviihabitans]|uniref:RHS repeat-associated core domain-containing protein n=1 Tax=Candidatus Aalborgicola defluviihabitans TaxID=3386187 RepID=UPI0039B83A97